MNDADGIYRLLHPEALKPKGPLMVVIDGPHHISCRPDSIIDFSVIETTLFTAPDISYVITQQVR